MDRNDQQAITDLFGKLADVERQGQPRDGDSEAFIADQISRQPGAPYYMAQTIVVQEQALKAAEARISELESSTSQGSGGFLGGLFGGGSASNARGSVPSVGRSPMGAPRMPQGRGRSGGGFLAGAAQTAMETFDTVSAESEARVVILSMGGVPTMDATGLIALESILDRLKRSNSKVILTGLRPEVAALFERAGIRKVAGQLAFAPDVETAISMAIVHDARVSMLRPAVAPSRNPRPSMSENAQAASPVRWKPNIE